MLEIFRDCENMRDKRYKRYVTRVYEWVEIFSLFIIRYIKSI